MNASTLEKRKKELHEKINAQCKQFPGMKLVIKDKKLINEMINSLLCYDCVGFKNAEEVMQKEEKSDFNYLKTYVEKLGRERVVELIQEQIDSIEHVESGVFVDDEFVSYNSIVWKT